MDSQLKQDLIAARALIETPEKWMKGPWPEDGRMCVLRAVEKVCGLAYGEGPYSPVGKALQDQLGVDAIGPYNDLPTTTHADVLSLFDRAIAAA